MATNIVQNSEFANRRSAPTPQEGVTQSAKVDICAEQIRERAYYIFLARGNQPGSCESDWARAERELRAEALKRPAIESAERIPARSQIVEPRAGAGIPAAAAVNARRTPVLFSGG